jgi:FkbM family methyltransferase
MAISAKRRLLGMLGLDADRLDARSWLVQRRGPHQREALRMGPQRARTHLVVDPRAARRALPRQQMQLLDHLASEHVAWVLDRLGINCVLDVGANVGGFGRRLRRAGYTGRIVSFEPLPHLARQLHKHADPDPNWRVMRYALGDEDTSMVMNVSAGSGKTSSLLTASDFGKEHFSKLTEERKVEVKIRRLDGLLDEAVAGLDQPRTFLKMDTQGFDLRVFDGAGARIDDILGLQSELSNVPIYEQMPRLPEAIRTYEKAGFEATGFFPVTRDHKRLRLIELDVVMVRSDAVPAR